MGTSLQVVFFLIFRISILTSLIQADLFPEMYLGCHSSESGNLLKILDGVIHSAYEKGTVLDVPKTSCFMVDILQESVQKCFDNVQDFINGQTLDDSVILLLDCSIQYWMLMSEGPVLYHHEWAQLELPKVLTRKKLHISLYNIDRLAGQFEQAFTNGFITQETNYKSRKTSIIHDEIPCDQNNIKSIFSL